MSCPALNMSVHPIYPVNVVARFKNRSTLFKIADWLPSGVQ
jgi:hypothetical protein